MKIKRIFQLALCVVISTSSLFSQLTRGFASGTVQDATGALIVDAKVTLTNTATNLKQEMSTNGRGIYRFVAVEPGPYTVEFAKAGFETRRVMNISIGTVQEVVLNQTLSVASATATVEVVDSSVGVDLAKTSATMERKLSQKFIEDAPLSGALRDVNVMALVAPTVSRGPGSTGISANGNRARNNNFMLDGVDNNDLSVTLVSNRVIPEGLAEFQIQTASYSAEFGRNSGAQISAITRSGTNQFHGEMFDYYRANWMEPVSLLNKRANVNSTPRFNHNQAGGLLGGPVIKDRTFFFGLVETNRRREAPDARNATAFTIPTPAGFAALGRVPLGTDQTTQSRQAMLTAIGFLSSVHSRVSSYQNVHPVNVNGVAIETGQGRIPLANPYDMWYYQGRVDHRITDNDTLSYRFQIDKRNEPDVVSNLQFGNLFSGAQTILGQNHAVSHTKVITPRLINEFRFGYVRRNLDFPENDPKSPTTTILGLFTLGGSASFPQGRLQNALQFQNVTTFLQGRHSFKIGADIRYNKLLNRAAFDSKGTWTFNNLEDFLNNRAFSLAQAVNESSFDARQTTQFYFFQDDIKVTRDLTFNVGLRYEYSDIPFGFFGASSNEVAAVGVPRPSRADKNNFAPTAGFAYSPSSKDGFAGKLFGDGRTVFRGDYRIGYDVLFYNILVVNASNFPRVVTNLTNQPGTFNLYPTLAPKSPTAPPLNPLATFVNSPEDIENPTTHTYSFSIQRQVATNYFFELGYSGSRSYHQIRQGQGNPGVLTPAQAATVRASGNPNSIPGLQARRVNPAWGSRVSLEANALGYYNAGFIRFDKKFSSGLGVGANYTYSNLMSDNDESLGVTDITNSSSQVPQDYFNYKADYARSAFDRPHRFVVHFNYDLPWFAGSSLNSAPMKHIFRNWSITGITDFQSGQPFGMRTGVDSGGTGTTGPFRPDYNAGGTFAKDPISGDLRTFVTPINGTGIVLSPLTPTGQILANSMYRGGNLGKNTFRGPAFANWNLNLSKRILITERWSVQLRGDFINLWNHRNFGVPSPFMNSPAFGTNTSNPGTRTMLVSAKIRF